MATAKKSVKKGTSKKKGKTKPPMTAAQRDFEINKLVAIYWEQFGRGAGLPVDKECFDKSVELGALANIKTHLAVLSTYGKDFKQAEMCSLKAGKQAKKLANSANPKLKSINAATYETAFQHVANQVSRVAKRTAASSKPKSEGLLC